MVQLDICQNDRNVQSCSHHTCEKTKLFLRTEGLVGLPPLLIWREQLISDVIQGRPLVTIVLYIYIYIYSIYITLEVSQSVNY